MLSLLSSSKDFHNFWLGSKTLNKLGLHTYRMRLAKLTGTIRSQLSGSKACQFTQQLDQQGYVVIPDFLPQDTFESLYLQVKGQVSHSLDQFPPNAPHTKGFGVKQPFRDGFDRYDGSTLNRFLDIKHLDQQALGRFTNDWRLDSLCRKVSGFSVTTNRLLIYLMVNGEMLHNPDNQKMLHRDTFHSTLKFWYFLEDVEEEQAPFFYVPGSHKLNKKRLEWEHHQALIACGAIEDPYSLNGHGGGAFRIREDELEALGYPEPNSIPVSGNTLVLANTNGFHRRGDAIPGTQRLALYGWRRPWPFLLKGW